VTERQVLEHWIKLFLKRVLTPHVSPHAVAMGTAIGVFLAFTPTVGLQMILAALIATALGVSRAAAVIPVWISNPLTLVPIYGSTYWVGWQLTGGPTTGQFIDRLRAVVSRLEGHGFWEFLDRFGQLLTLGADTLAPLTVGGIVVGLAAGALSYGLIRLMIRWYPNRSTGQGLSACPSRSIATQSTRRAA
jgi:hypothetical protein